MNAKEYTKGKIYRTGSGFPVGRTNVDLNKAEFQDGEYTDAKTGKSRPTIQVVLGDTTYTVPVSVMKVIQQAVELGYSIVEINRQGTTKDDTTYVTYILDNNGKIVESKK